MADPSSEAWGVLLPQAGRVTLYAVDGGAVRAHDVADADDAARAAGVLPERLITLNDAASDAPPTSLLPQGARSLSAVQQIAPAARLDPSARVLIAGALRAQPDWDGIILIPEAEVTHWVHVSAREIVSFQGAATGRLAAALGAPMGSGGARFDTGALGDTMSRPERLAVHLNAAVLGGDAAAVLGHLLGAELAAMRAYWLGQELRIIGAAAPYAPALAVQGVMAEAVPRAAVWQAGLMALGAAAGLTD
ncbi:2-dehydro-3-deoxygalactonokinase [Roseovarius nanhaiticus]|uniref:2-dehydro-3-deoxygalactonokinase n=1 Tax=Roseovarius nanhaiticus TaxID=573024 RepID=A0A1N7EC39_9RHOB|nr:2-dehydro-3-deoxygalactonokinase [Roseovarius nanhaiticus]SEK77761.1 2-dehydro-3-deoxygalactonokinase [Roseovarius nanhaiticus]SIR85667.1 2-dehydro-3-deoxygalactonokinase [Roseovarius nanhaiticus]